MKSAVQQTSVVVQQTKSDALDLFLGCTTDSLDSRNFLPRLDLFEGMVIHIIPVTAKTLNTIYFRNHFLNT